MGAEVPGFRFVGSLVLVLGSVTSLAQETQTFTGVIFDDMCAYTGHAAMKMGPTDADCTRACVEAHGAKFVLLDGKTVYGLSDQQTPEEFAGSKVTVIGILDAKTNTIQVKSISAAK
jgi:hypothetical protein